MGIVYAATTSGSIGLRSQVIGGVYDEALDAPSREPGRRRVSHPDICQLYEIGEDRQTLFIVMELLQGESLADRVALVLSAFRHHPDRSRHPCRPRCAPREECRPSRPEAVKRLHHPTRGETARLRSRKDQRRFSRRLDRGDGECAESARHDHRNPEVHVSRTGARLSARQPRRRLRRRRHLVRDALGGSAFTGETLIEVLHAVAYEEPPQLVAAARCGDAIVHRALAKDPRDRYPLAASMARELRALPGGTRHQQGPAVIVPVQPRSWLIVLPFRVRWDPDAEFLAFGLVTPLQVRFAAFNSWRAVDAVASRFAADVPDLPKSPETRSSISC